MTDLPPSTGSEDRTVGIDPVDGLSFESDGAPIAELAVESLDTLMDRGTSLAEVAANRRAWRFGHVIVDEAQDLSPMQWRMINRRARKGSMTIVGDLAQRSIGEPGVWDDHLPEALADFAYRELTINYRSPAEVNELAAAVLAELAPGLAPSRAIRSVGHRPVVTAVADRHQVLIDLVAERRAELSAGRLAVIGMDLPGPALTERAGAVQWLTPWQAKGLEFDAVLLVDPATILEAPGGLSLLYVGITRTTERLEILHHRPLPSVLDRVLRSTPSE